MPLPPANRTNTTPMQDIHPDDHNQFSTAIAALQVSVSSLLSSVSSLSGQVSDVADDISALQATAADLQDQIDNIGSSGSDATAVAAALAAHQAATTSVHGIADTSLLLGSSNDTVGDVIEADELPSTPVADTLYLIPLT